MAQWQPRTNMALEVQLSHTLVQLSHTLVQLLYTLVLLYILVQLSGLIVPSSVCVSVGAATAGAPAFQKCCTTGRDRAPLVPLVWQTGAAVTACAFVVADRCVCDHLCLCCSRQVRLWPLHCACCVTDRCVCDHLCLCYGRHVHL